MPNLELVQKRDLSSFRRIAIGTWKTAFDPSVYGSMTLNMDEALRFNRIYLRKDVAVFFQVSMKDQVTGEIDLSGCTVHGAHRKSLFDIVEEFDAQVAKVRAHKDEQLENTRSMFKRIPYRLLNAMINTIGFLAYELNLDMRWAGVPQDAFGSVMVTNIGSLGLEEAYVPLVPYSRVPLLIAIGAVNEVPVVRDGAVVIAQQMRVCATFDHRILDGSHAAVMSRVLREWFEQPFEHFDRIDDLPVGD